MGDLITDEIRFIRRHLAAQCGNDLKKIFADVREREAASGRTLVSLPPRRIEATGSEETHKVKFQLSERR